jgi:cell shape-determining protein MreC
MKNPLILIRNVFLSIFILATLSAFFLFLRSAGVGMLAASPASPETVVVQPEQVVGIVASVVTSLTTLVGFVVTTVLTVRREKRESLEAGLAFKQKEIELQKALLELETLKKKNRSG